MANRRRKLEDIGALDYPSKRRRILKISKHKINTRPTDVETSHWKYLMIEHIQAYIEEEISKEEYEEGSSLGSLSDYSFSDTDSDSDTSTSDDEEKAAAETENHQVGNHEHAVDSQDATAADMLQEHLDQQPNPSPVPEIPAELNRECDAVANLDEVATQNEVDSATSFLEVLLQMDLHTELGAVGGRLS